MPVQTDVLRRLPKNVQVEGAVRLPHIAIVLLDKQGKLPVVPLSEVWDGKPRKLETPTTINSAIAEATVHQTMMGLEAELQDKAGERRAHGETEDLDDTISHTRGVSSFPVDKRTALLHGFLPTQEQRKSINNADPKVIKRREAGVPSTVNAVKFYASILDELTVQVDEDTGLPVKRAQSFSVTADEMRENLQTREARGENALSARFETVLDTLVTEWAAREAEEKANAEEKRPLPPLYDSPDSDRPTDVDGHKSGEHIVFKALDSTYVQDGEWPGHALMNRVDTVFDTSGQLKVGLEGDDAKLVDQIVDFRPDGIELVFNQTVADAAADPNRALQIANRVRITPKSALGKRISQGVKEVRSH